MEADKDGDGKLNFEEFTAMVAKTVSSPLCTMSRMTLGSDDTRDLGYRQANDSRGFVLNRVWLSVG